MNIKGETYDLVVVGATPAGIMTAIAAARLGSSVALLEYHAHIGGMSTSGLGKSDLENKKVIAGFFKEFTQKVHRYYINKYGLGSKNEKLCREGYYYEPSVAEIVFNDMVREEKNIVVFLEYRIEDAITESNKVVEVVFKNRRNHENLALKGKIFVDATYEGDLYAHADAGYRLGREGKNEFNEIHAGKIFFDHDDHLILQGSTGEADSNLPAYTYRLCLTDDPKNSYILREPPPGYNREYYTMYLQDLEEGRLKGPKVLKEEHGYYPAHFNTMLRVFSFAEIPNRKYDVNINPRPLGFPFPEENREYVESDWAKREHIFQRHRELVLGLLYFVQNDPEVPEDHREMAKKYHLPIDEFVDNQHFPLQLYVREARRLKGKYTLTENDLHPNNDARRSTIFNDSIIAGEFPIDSFPLTKEPSANRKVLEGYISMLPVAPYQIPLRILLSETIGRLIVPVAASTSHIAYSTVRMEPLWMGIGQAAGTLAHLSIQMELELEAVPIHYLQKLLLENQQILTCFHDLDLADKAFQASQFWGTKGFFSTYYANLRDPLSAIEMKHWLNIFKKELGEKWEDIVRKIVNENSFVSISSFTSLINRLAVNYVSGDAENYKINHPNLHPEDWLYDFRDTESPVLKGEVCLALFNLYFHIKTYS